MTGHQLKLFFWSMALVGILSALGFGLTQAAQRLAGSNAASEFAGLVTVRSFDIVADGDHLHVLAAGRIAPDQPVRLAYRESRDGGRSWSAPSFIDTGGREVISSRGNDVRLAVHQQRRVAVFQVRGRFPGNGPLSVARSEDGGRHWSPASQPVKGDNLDNQSYPDVQADAGGMFHLVWLDDREEHGSTQGLRYASSRDGGQTWSQETTIDTEVCTCCSTRLSHLPDRQLALLYRDHAPQDMRLALQDPAEARWSRQHSVGRFEWSFEGCPHTSAGLTGTREGGRTVLHAAIWTGKEGQTGVHYLRSTDLGRHWTTTRLVDGAGSDPDIAAGPARRLAMAYRSQQGAGDRIALVQSENGGQTWSAPRFLDNPIPGARADRPRVVATGEGFRVLWTERLASGEKRLASAGL